MINKNSKILLTGYKGMVGSMLLHLLNQKGYSNIIPIGKEDLNLLDASAVDSFFNRERPEYVFMIAAIVGGIQANMNDPVGFMVNNLKIEINLFEACFKYKTKKNLFMGSSCIYPKECSQPMKEEYLMTGPLEPTNEGYALSKIAGLRMAQYYDKQYKMMTACPMPCNIYGSNEHYDLEKSHVLSALIRRFTDAKEAGKNEVTLWGTGIARREFIHVEDAAGALIYLMETHESSDIVNIGWGTDISIKELAELIKVETGFQGNIQWDPSKPDGMMRKCMDVSRMKAIGFSPKIDLSQGIQRSIGEFTELRKKGLIK